MSDVRMEMWKSEKKHHATYLGSGQAAVRVDDEELGQEVLGLEGDPQRHEGLAVVPRSLNLFLTGNASGLS